MNSFRVPKKRQEAELTLVGGASHRVAVFLAEQARGHGGTETLKDLLNETGEFIPVECLATGRTLIFRRAAIAMAKTPIERQPDDPVSFTLPTEHEVELELHLGIRLTGLLSYVAPPGRSRLIDFLEDSPQFFPVTDDETTYLVNKGHVVSVSVTDGIHGSTRSGN